MRVLKFLIKQSLLFCALLSLLISCEYGVDSSIKHYCDKWSTTCRTGDVNFLNSVKLSGIDVVSAKKDIEIRISIMNPASHKLLSKLEPYKNCFVITNQEGSVRTLSNYKEESLENDTLIRITGTLDDAWEGEKLILKGYLAPDIMPLSEGFGFHNEALRKNNPELFIEKEFIQNTPPDDAKNLEVPEDESLTKSNQQIHYLTFELENQTLCRNKDAVFEFKTFKRLNNRLECIDTEELTFDDIKNLKTNNNYTKENTYIYYSQKQEESILYEYSIQITGKHQRKSELVGTAEGAGVCFVKDPELILGTNAKSYGRKITKDNIEYEVIEYTGDSLSFTSKNTFSGSQMYVEVKKGNSTTNKTANQYTHELVNKEDAFCNVKLTVKKDKFKTSIIEKNYYCVRALTKPNVSFLNGSVEDKNNKLTVRYNYLQVNNEFFSVSNSYTGTDSSIEVYFGSNKISDKDFSNRSISDGVYNFKVIVSKDNCEPYIFERSLDVNIKPVYVRIKDNKIKFDGDDGSSGSSYDPRLKCYIGSESVSQLKIVDYSQDEVQVGKGYYDIQTTNDYIILYEKTNYFYFFTDTIQDDDGSKTADSLGKVEKTDDPRTLSELKSSSPGTYYYFEGSRPNNGGDDGGWFKMKFYVTLSLN